MKPTLHAMFGSVLDEAGKNGIGVFMVTFEPPTEETPVMFWQNTHDDTEKLLEGLRDLVRKKKMDVRKLTPPS